MENQSSNSSDSEAPKELTPRSANIQANKKTNKAKKRASKASKNKKWSLRRHWREASRRTQMKWVGETILIIAGVIAAGSYVFSNLQTRWNFAAEHKPLVIHPRPPEMQFVRCKVGVGFQWGNVDEIFKNIGNVTAEHVSPMLSFPAIITEKPTANPFYKRPTFSDGDCAVKGPSIRGGELEPGVERTFTSRQGAASLPTDVHAGDFVQTELKTCVYYAEKDGTQHTTCDFYGFGVFTPDRSEIDLQSGAVSIPCDGVEYSGVFTAYGHCQR